MENQQHWEAVGSAYSASWEPPAKQMLSRRELAFIAEHLRRTGARTALDVGIGNGRIIDALLRATTTTRFHGIDIAREMVAVCQERFAGEERVQELIACDISQLRLPMAQEFDFISAIRVLKYSENWSAIVAYLISRLSPGGVLVFSMPNRASINAASRDYAVPWHSSSKAQLAEVVQRAGADVLDVTGFVRLPYVLYERPRRPRLVRLVTGTDLALQRLLGDELLTRELFVAAARRPAPAP
jgi:2-polyprenyl-3-methyl-5-hydroxy-6-metoxy-1,4-benzoquinol methylase